MEELEPIRCHFINPDNPDELPYLKIEFSRQIAWENIQEIAQVAAQAITNKMECMADCANGCSGGCHGTA